MQVAPKRDGINLSPEAVEALKKAGPQCTKCVHAQVCVIYPSLIGIARQFDARIVTENNPNIHAPFKPEDFAKICEEYLPFDIPTEGR